MKCAKVVCQCEAQWALALSFYPPQVFMDKAEIREPVTHMIVKLFVCDEHSYECANIPANEMVDNLEDVCHKISLKHNTVVDPSLTTVTPIPITHPVVQQALHADRIKNHPLAIRKIDQPNAPAANES